MKLTLFASLLCLSALAQGTTLSLQSMLFDLPDGWTVVQRALSGDTRILGIARGDQYVTLYSRPQTGLSLPAMYHANAQATGNAYSESYGALAWQARDTAFTGGAYVHGFLTEFGGRSYYGFSRAGSADAATKAAHDVLESMRLQLRRSLTDEDYGGKKYYLGWGAAMPNDPDQLLNEVKFDVQHTHAIFTRDIGGGYLPTTLFGAAATGNAITSAWNTIKAKLTPDDMFVQYSSGHGYPGGLVVGVTHPQIRDAILSLPARELIVFTMACYAGGLVDSFNQRKSEWQSWPDQGRALFVMASSRASETSSAGPGTDPDEPSGANGSAGSAFGHALWKALIGEADGALDGVKDGFLSLGEIREYATRETLRISTELGLPHTPVHTGAYPDSLIMNRVPPRALVESLEKEDVDLLNRVFRVTAEE